MEISKNAYGILRQEADVLRKGEERCASAIRYLRDCGHESLAKDAENLQRVVDDNLEAAAALDAMLDALMNNKADLS